MNRQEEIRLAKRFQCEYAIDVNRIRMIFSIDGEKRSTTHALCMVLRKAISTYDILKLQCIEYQIGEGTMRLNVSRR